MSTKGASNRYGNSKGGNKGGKTNKIAFAWAKDFDKYSAKRHFNEHGKQMKSTTINEYKAKAVKFANTTDKKNVISYVRTTDQTVKFNTETGEIAVVNKKGYVETYFIPRTGYKYYEDDRRNHAKIKRKHK